MIRWESVLVPFFNSPSISYSCVCAYVVHTCQKVSPPGTLCLENGTVRNSGAQVVTQQAQLPVFLMCRRYQKRDFSKQILWPETCWQGSQTQASKIYEVQILQNPYRANANARRSRISFFRVTRSLLLDQPWFSAMLVMLSIFILAT